MFTEQQLERLEAALRSATPAPWVFEPVNPRSLDELKRLNTTWFEGQAYHTICGWSHNDQALVQSVIRELPALLRSYRLLLEAQQQRPSLTIAKLGV